VKRKPIKFLLLAIFSLFLVGCGRSQPKDPKPEPKPKLISQADLPTVFLTPYVDKHRLDITISNIKAPRMDYQIIYTANINGNQVERGFGGRDIKVNSNQLIREGKDAVVFGSESSGKFKYDEGVKNGSIEITYRDDKGKVTGRASSDWVIYDSSEKIKASTADGKITFTPDLKTKATVLLMNTLGLPSSLDGNPVFGPYGIFTSNNQKIGGTVTIVSGSQEDINLFSFYQEAGRWKNTALQLKPESQTIIQAPVVITGIK